MRDREGERRAIRREKRKGDRGKVVDREIDRGRNRERERGK